MLENLKFVFDPGDGSTSIVRRGDADLSPFSHAYTAPGSYTQILTASFTQDGSFGWVQQRADIVVTAPELPPVEPSIPTFVLTGRAAGSGFGFS